MKLRDLFSTAKKPPKEGGLLSLLSSVDQTYANLPPSAKLEAERISQALPEFGARKLRKGGTGFDVFEIRPYQPGDESRHINQRKTAAGDDVMINVRQAEIRHHVYLGIYGDEDYKSEAAGFSIQESIRIMLISLARKLAKDEELVGVLGSSRMFRGGNVAENIQPEMRGVNIVAGQMFPLKKNLPPNSTVILAGAFLGDLREIMKDLGTLSGTNMQCIVIPVLDPFLMDFPVTGPKVFEWGDQKPARFEGDVSTIRSAYQERIREHFVQLEDFCKARGFRLTVQRTDKPLWNALLSVLGERKPEQISFENPKP